MINFLALFSAGIFTPPRSYQLAGGTKIHIALNPAEANATWTLTGIASGNGRIVGKVQNDGWDTGDAIVYSSGFNFTTPSTGWGSLWFRLTNTEGTADSSSVAIDGTTWYELQEGLNNIFWYDTHGGPIPETNTVLVEMSTDASGTPIVASGSYSTVVSSEF